MTARAAAPTARARPRRPPSGRTAHPRRPTAEAPTTSARAPGPARRTVPASVPSLRHSSCPSPGVPAAKNAQPPHSANRAGAREAQRRLGAGRDVAQARRAGRGAVRHARARGPVAPSSARKTTRVADARQQRRLAAGDAGPDVPHARRPRRRCRRSARARTRSRRRRPTKNAPVRCSTNSTGARSLGARPHVADLAACRAAVPSLRQGSDPCIPSSAAKYSRPPAAASVRDAAETRPGDDASHAHRSGLGAVALPQLVALVRLGRREEERAVHDRQLVRARGDAPGSMSRTRTVPASVPSVVHSSLPWASSRAVGRRARCPQRDRPPTPQRMVGRRDARPCRRRCRRCARATRPARRSAAGKYSAPRYGVKRPGKSRPAPGARSASERRAGLGAVAAPQLRARARRRRPRRRSTPPTAPPLREVRGRGRRCRCPRSSTLPAAVPSLVQGSLGRELRRDRPGGAAVKYSRPPVDASRCGAEPSEPGRRSRTTVPAAVPSLVHSSRPCAPSSAEKKSAPPCATRCIGGEARRDPLTGTVPAAVPSLRHSSWSTPGWSPKNRRRPTAVSSLRVARRRRRARCRGRARCRRRCRRCARARGPSAPSSAAKKSAPPIAVRARSGSEDVRPGAMSRTSAVTPEAEPGRPGLAAVHAVVGGEEEDARRTAARRSG